MGIRLWAYFIRQAVKTGRFPLSGYQSITRWICCFRFAAFSLFCQSENLLTF
jgi:hypothetical protein